MGEILLEIEVRGSIEQVFDWARSIEVHCATAAFTGERVVEPGRLSGLLELGDLVTFEARHLAFRRRLTAEIVEFDPPNQFADEMRKGAFKSLRHVHEFEARGGVTLMRDHITWTAPLGVLGKIADALFLELHMRWFLETKQRNLHVFAKLEAAGETPTS